MTRLTEQQILEKLLAGDEIVFQQVFKQYHSAMQAVGYL